MKENKKKLVDVFLFSLAFPHEVWHYIAGRVVGVHPKFKIAEIEIDAPLSNNQAVFIAALPALMDMIGMVLWIWLFPHANKFTTYLFWAGILYWASGILGASHDYKLILTIWHNKKDNND